jgi:hypothetical protein
MSPLLTTLLRPFTRARSSRDPIAQAGRKRNPVTLPMGADPASIVIVGTVVLFALLSPDTLIVGLIAVIVLGVARSFWSRPESKSDDELAARFRELEDGIVGIDTAETQRLDEDSWGRHE